MYLHKLEKYKAMKECCYCDFSTCHCRKGHPCSGYKKTVKSNWDSKHRIKNRIKKEIETQIKEYGQYE